MKIYCARRNSDITQILQKISNTDTWAKVQILRDPAFHIYGSNMFGYIKVYDYTAGDPKVTINFVNSDYVEESHGLMVSDVITNQILDHKLEVPVDDLKLLDSAVYVDTRDLFYLLREHSEI